MPKDSKEAQKRATIETAAKLIKSDIKSVIELVMSEYPKASDMTMKAALEYVPSNLCFMLQLPLVEKDTQRKLSSIDHAIIQAVCPRTVIAPLRFELAIQMHHQTCASGGYNETF